MQDLISRIASVAEIAGAHAEEVDRDARFPSEALVALKANRLLGLMVPREGGGEASLFEVAQSCFTLAHACTSTAMIFAMHQIMVACLSRHAGGSEWHLQFLQKLDADQLLLAGSTTEATSSADQRTGDCAIKKAQGRISLAKDGAVISYATEADGIMIIARRSLESPPSDQAFVLLRSEDCTLEHVAGWNSLGMRGTCSVTYRLQASAAEQQIFQCSYAHIHSQTMLPVAHLLWCSVWAGAAASAVERARICVRRSGSHDNAANGTRMSRLLRAKESVHLMRAATADALRRYNGATAETIESFEFQLAMNLLKVQVSDLAVTAVLDALQVCGLAGYRNDHEYSVARHLRDLCSAPLMIGNDRIMAHLLRPGTLIPESGNLL